MPAKSGSDLFLVDNSDSDWKVLRHIREWCQLAKGIDIATGYFEISSLLALNEEWQKVDIRSRAALVGFLNEKWY